MKTKLNQSKIKLAIASAVIVGSAGLSATSYAATGTATMTVSTTVPNSCTISVGAMDFLAYDTTAAAATTATALVTSNCTSGGATTITLGQGNTTNGASLASAPLRQMSGGGQVLNYNLYKDVAGGTVWGNTIAKGLPVTATGGDVITTIYGSIAPQQNVTAASFSDSVTVTLTY